MKRFFLAALLLFAAVAFTGCDNDDDDLYDTLSGRVWAGDLGFYQDGRIPLDSYVYFGADGFGTDELRYADTGRYLDTLNIQWDAYDDKIYISYGRADYPRELRNVYIRRGRLTGELFIDGQYYDRGHTLHAIGHCPAKPGQAPIPGCARQKRSRQVPDCGIPV